MRGPSMAWTAALLVAGLMVSGATAQEATPVASVVEIGKPLPDFRLNTDTGRAVALSDLREGGKWTVLALFPKALTPG